MHHHVDLSAGGGSFTVKQFAHSGFQKLLFSRLGGWVERQQGDQAYRQAARLSAECASVRRHIDGSGECGEQGGGG